MSPLWQPDVHLMPLGTMIQSLQLSPLLDKPKCAIRSKRALGAMLHEAKLHRLDGPKYSHINTFIFTLYLVAYIYLSGLHFF